MSPLRNENSSVSPTESRAPSTSQETERSSAPAVTKAIESMIRKIGIDKVYGSPITKGQTTVIPVADLRTGFGFGSGHNAEAEASQGEGGGAGLRLTPRGYLEVTPDGVRYRPIYSVSTLVLGGAFAGWLLYRLLSRR